jgi:hypothetical protein
MPVTAFLGILPNVGLLPMRICIYHGCSVPDFVLFRRNNQLYPEGFDTIRILPLLRKTWNNPRFPFSGKDIAWNILSLLLTKEHSTD